MTIASNLRRHFLACTTGAVTAGALLGNATQGRAQTAPQSNPTARSWPKFRYCLNTSTINGGEVPVREQLQIAATAGYDAVELWLRDVSKHVEAGGTVADLAKEISDLGLGLDSAIAFGNWIGDDEKERQAGLEQCRRDMQLVRDLGGQRIAAPPVGATKEPKLDLSAAADRYRRLLEIGAECEVTPQVELWGFSYNLATLAEVLYLSLIHISEPTRPY